MPIKYGSSLTGKLWKRYWEKEHVKGKPLIIAIHDFHQASTMEQLGSMTWSRNALIYYLYRIRADYRIAEDGLITLGIVDTKDGISQAFSAVAHYEWKGKKIESGFF